MRTEIQPFYRIDKFLTILEKSLRLPKAVREYPIEDVFNKHLEILKNTPFDFQLEAGKEYFKHKLHLPDGDYYELTWDIAKLKEVVVRNCITTVAMDLHEQRNDITYNVEKINNYKVKDEPLIVGEMMVMNTNLVLDGNHRITYFYKNNIKYTALNYLQSNMHCDAIVSNFMKNLFALHNNVVKIGYYMTGDIDNLDDHLINIS